VILEGKRKKLIKLTLEPIPRESVLYKRASRWYGVRTISTCILTLGSSLRKERTTRKFDAFLTL